MKTLSSTRPYLSILLAGLMVSNLVLPAWADYRLTDHSAEEDLGLVSPPPPSTEFPEEKKIFHFDQGMWDRARDAIDNGEKPEEKVTQPVVAVSTAPAAPKVDEAGIDVELPYESGLSISGRKLISVRLKETRRKSAKRAQELGVSKIQHDFEMKQELQVRIKGKVGRKITVNVDFDDTKEDKRDISVMYQGDPEEVVQEAAFGDITLSLPSTEFVSYSKQLFGVRTKLKYKRAQLMLIGSRTKGITETKRFTGNTQFERKELLDTNYIPHRYYQLAFAPSDLPLQVGSERVVIDDRDPTNDVSTNTLTVEDYQVTLSTFTGNFDQKFPGRDYTVDYVKGIITFLNTLPANAVVAVDYRRADGTQVSANTTRLKLLKTENDLPLGDPVNEVGYRRELKTYYSIGRNRIMRDNGRGNFILKTIDLNRNDNSVSITDGVSQFATLRYPDNLQVDFEAGVFNILPPLKVDDPTLYAASPTHKFSFYMEYRFRLKTYLVRPGLVLGSERVTMDGRLLARDLDYFVDYDSGFLTFFNEDSIDDNTQIEVTYEYAPFGGQLGQTLVGGRTELSVVPDKAFIGSTFLYTFAPKPTAIPDVRSTPNSLLVLEADSSLTNIKVPGTGMTFNASGEIAQSMENPNLFGNALVDSMEGIKQEDPAIMNATFWMRSSNPSVNSVTNIGDPDALLISDAEIKLQEINPDAQVQEGQTQRVLSLAYNLPASSPTVQSIVQPLSTSGRDFSKKSELDIWVDGSTLGAADASDLVIDVGKFNEDFDGKGGVVINGLTRPKTEDLNLDGSLNLGEDIGWDWIREDNSLRRIGAENGRVDTEDLDADGVLNTQDVTPRGVPLFQLSAATNALSGVTFYDPVAHSSGAVTSLGFTGWRIIRVPLNILTTEEPNFQAIKQVRVSVKGQGVKGTIRIGNISFVGDRWEKPILLGNSTMTVTAVNNLDTPGYVTMFNTREYNDLYKDDTRDRVKEQALALNFTLPAASSATTREVYLTPHDLSKHKAFRFFLRTPATSANGETVIVQLGSETDYFQYEVPINDVYRDQWVMETINMVDLNNDSTPDSLEPLNPRAKVTVVGRPTMAAVGQIKVGVRNDTGSPITGEVWVNEMHVAGSREKTGTAKRVGADFTMPGWGSFGMKYRNVDRNFQTLTSQITNQDRLDKSGYLNFSRLSFLPLSFSGAKSETVTPAALQTGESGLVSILDEGKVKSLTSSGRGELLMGNLLPRLGFGFDESINDSNLLFRTDKRDVYMGNMSYTVPWKLDLVPGRVEFRPLPENIAATYRRTNYFLSFASEKRNRDINNAADDAAKRNAVFANVRTVEFTDDWSGRMNFTPWNGLTFAPTYSLKQVTEEKRFTPDDLAISHATAGPAFEAASRYPKSLAQTMGGTASWRLLRWLEPRFTYSINGTETNTLPSVSSPTAFNLKTVDRSADGEASWTFTARELAPNFKPVGSLSINNSYRVQDGDTYDGILADDNAWRRSFWVRKSLVLTNPGAQRRQLTQRDTYRNSGNWNPLDWVNFRSKRLEPFKTLSLTATVTRTREHAETTNTNRDSKTVIWPDWIFSLRDSEKIYGLQRFMDNSQWNVRTSRKKSETENVQFTDNKDFSTDYRFTLWKRYDFFLTYANNYHLDLNLLTHQPTNEGKGSSYSAQTGMLFGPWRYTPSYAFKTDEAHDNVRTLQDLTTKTYSLKARFDKAYPEGFRFPFSKKTFGNVNRFTLDAGLTFEQRRSSQNVESTNTDTYTLNSSGEWEISRNFRLSFGVGGSQLNNKVKKDDGLTSYEMTSQLIIQF